MLNKKVLGLVLLLPLCAVLFSGCGKTTGEPSILDQYKATQELGDLGKALGEGDTEDAGKALENLAKVSQKYELLEFEKAESLDLPAKFPKELAYTSDSKVTGVSDNSSDYELSFDVTVKTTDEFAKAKSFYQKLFADGWKITSQSSEGSSYSVDAEKDGASVSVSVDTEEMFSSLTQININYSKSLE
ncbi:MAG: hypothetical protein PHD51_00800 [Patescibacteria group bacterium]|nr:hypothetical protein [Patescibacteria group bacterium]MDD5490595.1 hypothetical protein [Patescibacteria group bacterium]